MFVNSTRLATIGVILVCVLRSVSCIFEWTQHGANSQYGIRVSTDGKYYMLFYNNQTWLASAATFFTVQMTTYDTYQGSLKLVNTTQDSGQDRLGLWQRARFSYLAGDTPVSIAFRVYQKQPAIVFEQHWPEGATQTSDGSSGWSVSGFPSFALKAGDVDLGFLSYGGTMGGDTGKSMGRWIKNSFYTSDYGGPLILFDEAGSNTLIMSPFSQFMAATNTFTHDKKAVAWGIMGSAMNIPRDFLYETIVFFGDQGINKAMSDWGLLMRTYYNRPDTYRKQDFTNNYLGYWLDGGAYYEFITERFKDYTETYMDIKAWGDSYNIPYRYTEIDEWFYCPVNGDCNNWGTIAWNPVPYIFPNGIKALSEKLGWPIHASNKWWSSDTIYAKQNGGNYTFLFDIDAKSAIPQDQAFWDWFMQLAKSRNIIVYEQDFQSDQWNRNRHLRTDVTVARTWLNQMGSAALKHGLTVQYCMERPYNILQALENPAVSQARMSDDYRPSGPNWKIGISSMFSEAIGIAAFKDNFFTGKVNPGYHFGPSTGAESHPALNCLIATLSTGPVGPSDKLGYGNATIIKRCCNADGLILQPDKPAMAINKQIIQNAFGGSAGPQGEVMTSYSDISGHRFGLILAADMKADYLLHPQDAEFGPQFTQNKVFSYNRRGLPTLMDFTADQPLKLSAKCSPEDFCLFYTTQVFTVGKSSVALLGELDKWVVMSAKRVSSMTLTSNDLQLVFSGKANEKVMFWFVRDEQLHSVSCDLSTSGRATLSVMQAKCS